MTTAVALAPADRARPYRRFSFRVFRIVDGRTYGPLDWCVGDPSTLAEAVQGYQANFSHKEHMLIVERDHERERETRHLYAIKRKSAGRWVYEDYQHRKVHDLYADPVCAMDEEVVSGRYQDALDAELGSAARRRESCQ